VNVNDVRQTEVPTVDPLLHEPSYLRAEIAVGKLKSYKSPGFDQTPAILIQAGGTALSSDIHKLINSIWNKKEVPQQWKESKLCLFVKSVM
jgi:hypothetical protein